MNATFTFSVFHSTAFGWSHSNLGARCYVTLDSAINAAERLERGAYQIHAIDENGNHAIVHERLS